MSALWLRGITPISTGLALVPGVELREPTGYRQFWNGLADASPELGAGAERLVLAHATTDRLGGRYATLTEDSLAHPVHLVSARLPDQPATEAFPELTDIEVRLYDHNIGIVEFVADVSDYFDGSESIDAQVASLERSATDAGEQLLANRVAPWVHDLVAALVAHDPDEEVVSPTKTPVEQLWTSRALFCTVQRLRDEQLGRCWLRNAEVGDEQVTALEQGRADHVTTWLNYAFTSPDPGRAVAIPHGEALSDAWEGLRYAQYYYAALDGVDRRLALVLAQTHVDQPDRRLSELRDDLTSESQRAELIRIERQLTEKFLRRPVRAAMLQILAGWSFEELVAGPAREKAELCTRRVSAIAEAQSRRAAIWTDLILLGIAITSILGTALSVAAFGRSLGTDSSMAGYDSGTSAVVEWLASQPADAILLSSLVVSAGVAAIYLIYRRASQ